MEIDVEQYIDSKIGRGDEFRVKEVAAGFGVSDRTVRRYVQSGRLEAFRLFGFVIPRQAVRDFIENGQNF